MSSNDKRSVMRTITVKYRQNVGKEVHATEVYVEGGSSFTLEGYVCCGFIVTLLQEFGNTFLLLSFDGDGKKFSQSFVIVDGVDMKCGAL